MGKNIEIPSMESIRELIEPLLIEMKNIRDDLECSKPSKYYRNSDLKRIFGVSDNTLISYRKNNKIPYTHLGNIFYYPVDEITKILEKNSNWDLFNKAS